MRWSGIQDQGRGVLVMMLSLRQVQLSAPAGRVGWFSYVGTARMVLAVVLVVVAAGAVGAGLDCGFRCGCRDRAGQLRLSCSLRGGLRSSRSWFVSAFMCISWYRST
jgi:hypothetical protein